MLLTSNVHIDGFGISRLPRSLFSFLNLSRIYVLQAHLRARHTPEAVLIVLATTASPSSDSELRRLVPDLCGAGLLEVLRSSDHLFCKFRRPICS